MNTTFKTTGCLAFAVAILFFAFTSDLPAQSRFARPLTTVQTVNPTTFRSASLVRPTPQSLPTARLPRWYANPYWAAYNNPYNYVNYGAYRYNPYAYWGYNPGYYYGYYNPYLDPAYYYGYGYNPYAYWNYNPYAYYYNPYNYTAPIAY
jgi:hypothetical protein